MRGYRAFMGGFFAILLMSCATTPEPQSGAAAQADDAAFSSSSRELPAQTKWRAKDGTYAVPGNDFDEQCGEFGDVVIELAENTISGNERSCRVATLRDAAPNAIRLDLICDDYNLAISIGDPSPYDRKFREIMLLKKIDGDTISVRKTVNGKFTSPAWRAAYCPEEKQRWYRESQERAKAEAARTEKPSQ